MENWGGIKQRWRQKGNMNRVVMSSFFCLLPSVWFNGLGEWTCANGSVDKWASSIHTQKIKGIQKLHTKSPLKLKTLQGSTYLSHHSVSPSLRLSRYHDLLYFIHSDCCWAAVDQYIYRGGPWAIMYGLVLIKQWNTLLSAFPQVAADL